MILIILCGIFYSVLCIFSIVTGIMYMSGKKELNPIELSDNILKKISSTEKNQKFTKRMWLVTFLVGVLQGITAYSLLFSTNKNLYYFAIWFTIFSIISVLFKLKWKINTFSTIKLIFYIAILVILIINIKIFSIN